MKPHIKFSLSLMIWVAFFPLKWIFTVGIAVLLHETAHLMVCKAMGIRVLGMRALPWGLTADAPLMYEPFSQFAVSVAGPMMNFFLLFFCPLIKAVFSKEAAELFALANLADGIFNLIPALPLDGGIILKSFLCSKLGIIRGFECMIKITAFISAFMMLLGINIFISARGNISYFVAGAFMLWNLKHEKELILCLKKRILTGEIKSRPPIKVICAKEDSHAICLVKCISASHTIAVCVTNENGEIGTISQSRLLDCVLKNTMITVGECIEKN